MVTEIGYYGDPDTQAFVLAMVKVWPANRSAEFMSISRSILYDAVDRHITSAEEAASVKRAADSLIISGYRLAIHFGVPVEDLAGVLLLCETERNLKG